MPVIRPTMVTISEVDAAIRAVLYGNISVDTLQSDTVDPVPVYVEENIPPSADTYPCITIELIDESEADGNWEASDEVYEYDYNNSYTVPRRYMKSVPDPIQLMYQIKAWMVNDSAASRSLRKEISALLPRRTYLALDVAASIECTNSETYNLSGSETLTVKVDQGSVQTVTFQVADFAAPGSATAAEVFARINTDLTGATASEENSGKVTITSDTTGDDSYIEVTGGTANSGILDFSTHESQGGNRRLSMFREGPVPTIKEIDNDEIVLQTVWTYIIFCELDTEATATEEKVATNIQMTIGTKIADEDSQTIDEELMTFEYDDDTTQTASKVVT